MPVVAYMLAVHTFESARKLAAPAFEAVCMLAADMSEAAYMQTAADKARAAHTGHSEEAVADYKVLVLARRGAGQMLHMDEDLEPREYQQKHRR